MFIKVLNVSNSGSLYLRTVFVINNTANLKINPLLLFILRIRLHRHVFFEVKKRAVSPCRQASLTQTNSSFLDFACCSSMHCTISHLYLTTELLETSVVLYILKCSKTRFAFVYFRYMVSKCVKQNTKKNWSYLNISSMKITTLNTSAEIR